MTDTRTPADREKLAEPLSDEELAEVRESVRLWAPYGIDNRARLLATIDARDVVNQALANALTVANKAAASPSADELARLRAIEARAKEIEHRFRAWKPDKMRGVDNTFGALIDFILKGEAP